MVALAGAAFINDAEWSGRITDAGLAGRLLTTHIHGT